MLRRLSILVAVLGLSAGAAAAQEVDARAALLASLKAMGGENLKTIEIAPPELLRVSETKLYF